MSSDEKEYIVCELTDRDLEANAVPFGDDFMAAETYALECSWDEQAWGIYRKYGDDWHLIAIVYSGETYRN